MPTQAGARSACGHVKAANKVASDIEAHNYGCRDTRHHLRHWMKTHFPHSFTGWYCDMSSAQKLCSEGNGTAPPYFTFHLHHR
jgi:hypothetical protein